MKCKTGVRVRVKARVKVKRQLNLSSLLLPEQERIKELLLAYDVVFPVKVRVICIRMLFPGSIVERNSRSH